MKLQNLNKIAATLCDVTAIFIQSLNVAIFLILDGFFFVFLKDMMIRISNRK